MSMDWWWYAEGLVGGRWRIWPDSSEREWSLPHFARIPGYRSAIDVFLGRRSLIDMIPGLPEEPPSSEYLHFRRKFARDDDGPTFWCDYDDLLIEEWTRSTVLVAGRVPAERAHLFTNGATGFPEWSLLRAGLPVEDVKRIRDGKITHEVVDRTTGKPRHELQVVAPRHAVTVTWEDSVAGLLGQHLVEAFRAVAKAPGERRRVFASWG